MARLRVSVVIPCWRSERLVGACLRGLAAQTLGDFEVVIVNSSPGDGTAEQVAAELPAAIYLESAERLLPHAARNLALERCSGDILASIDPDCVPDPDWLERLTEPLRNGTHLTVGGMGTVPSGRRATGLHLCKYAGYLPGLEGGRRAIAPSANLALSRQAWETVGPFLGDRLIGDAVLSWRVERHYGQASFVPDAVVRHHHEEEPLKFLGSRRARGREFATTRVEGFGWSRARSAAHAIGLPLLAVPPVSAGLNAARRAGVGGGAFTSLPLHIAGHLAWTLGEAEAYVTHARAPQGQSMRVSGAR